MKKYNNIKRIGILGGGQLSMMLVDAAKRLGFETTVFLQRKDEPASQNAHNIIVGNFSQPESGDSFFSSIDIVLFENEFFDQHFLTFSSKYPKVQCIPRPESMKKVADKLGQKAFFDKLQIPTSPYETYDPRTTSIAEWSQQLQKRFESGFVIKHALGGYDGKGTLICTENNQEKIATFVQEADSKKIPIYAEAFIPYSCEFALLSTRSIQGNYVFYPPVLTTQSKGICTSVQGPAPRDIFTNELFEKIKKHAKGLAEEAELFGSFAIEFFLLDSGEYLANEMAPRVHNSGHFSQDISETSQFENHIRACTNLTLGKTESKFSFFGMINILGPDVYQGPIQPPICPFENTWLHWYYKSESRPQRKLGHINLAASDKNTLKAQLENIKKLLDAWQKPYTKGLIS